MSVTFASFRAFLKGVENHDICVLVTPRTFTRTQNGVFWGVQKKSKKEEDYTDICFLFSPRTDPQFASKLGRKWQHPSKFTKAQNTKNEDRSESIDSTQSGTMEDGTRIHTRSNHQTGSRCR